MKVLNDLKVNLALQIFDLGALLDAENTSDSSGFTLKLHEENPSATKAPFYLNLRTSDNPKPGPLTSEFVRHAGQALYQIALERQLPLGFVAGVPNAGDPFAAAFAKSDEFPIAYGTLRKKECHGKRTITELASIQPPIPVGTQGVLVDDLITGAGSKFEAIRALNECGLVVEDVLVLVNRQQGGAQKLLDQGIRLHALLTAHELFDILVLHKRITSERRSAFLSYLANNSV